MTTEITCPWCEMKVVLPMHDDEQTCPECLTSWSYEDGSEGLLLAA